MATERKIPEVGEEIHLPGPSAQPLNVAVASTVMLIGVTQSTPVIFIIGAVWLLATLFLWIRDAIAEFKALPEHHGDHGHADAHAHGHGNSEVDAPASAASDASVPASDKH